jgi:hypothetical protein
MPRIDLTWQHQLAEHRLSLNQSMLDLSQQA